MIELWIGIVIGALLTMFYYDFIKEKETDYDSDQWSSWEEDGHESADGIFYTTYYVRLKRTNKENGDVQYKKVVKRKEVC